MSAENNLPIFDGHNDVLSALQRGTRHFLQQSAEGHLDLPRARSGGLGGGFCAIYVAAHTQQEDPADDVRAFMAAASDPEHAAVTPEVGAAQRASLAMMATLFRLEAESQGQVRVVQTAREIRECLESGVFAALLHMEGAEAIDPDLDALEVFYRAGLRSLGLVWSRPNAFGSGVPFAFPSSPDTGPGLTEAGRVLVRACNRLGVLIDLSHLNERGFWEVAALSEAPLVATHSNAHALSPSSRNLTDRQLAAIKESGGVVGVNFHVGFLRADGADDAETPLSTIVRHVDYLVDRVGIDGVGLGSDFDGAVMPRELGDAAALPHLIDALRAGGYDATALRKIAHENWLRVLAETLGG